MTWPGRAVLQVPVPGLEGPVRARYERDDPTLLGIDPHHVHAHVTVLGPVPLGLRESRLRAAFASTRPFEYVLGEIGVFPNGIVHVRPHDPAPFRRLTAVARAALPGVEPYGGEFDPEPHVTIDVLRPGVRLDGIREELPLPVRGRASCVELVWYRSHEVHVMARYPLGG